jgi:hypothetical protein
MRDAEESGAGMWGRYVLAFRDFLAPFHTTSLSRKSRAEDSLLCTAILVRPTRQPRLGWQKRPVSIRGSKEPSHDAGLLFELRGGEESLRQSRADAVSQQMPPWLLVSVPLGQATRLY